MKRFIHFALLPMATGFFVILSATGIDVKIPPFVAVVKESVVMRSAPSDKAKKVVCDLYGPSEAGLKKKNASALPGGFRMQVVERSASKVKVGKWQNYWYKIRATDPEAGGPATCEDREGVAEAWVFGEFLSID